MNQHKKGFTILELLIVLVLICILVAVIIPAANRLRQKSMIKARAAVDLSNLHNAYVEISMKLMSDEGMRQISKEMKPIKCAFNPDAKLLINYTKPVTLEVYFVDDDQYYSIEYLTEIAEKGSSGLSTKKPFTLGLWYEAGVGKIDEYAKKD